MAKLVTNKIFPVFNGYKCDCCGRVDRKGDSEAELEIPEYLHYEDTCGYGATYKPGEVPYADGDRISISLCQYCKFKLLGQYIKVIKC